LSFSVLPEGEGDRSDRPTSGSIGRPPVNGDLRGEPPIAPLTGGKLFVEGLAAPVRCAARCCWGGVEGALALPLCSGPPARAGASEAGSKLAAASTAEYFAGLGELDACPAMSSGDEEFAVACAGRAGSPGVLVFAVELPHPISFRSATTLPRPRDGLLPRASLSEA
jgi:hypothetical protein